MAVRRKGGKAGGRGKGRKNLFDPKTPVPPYRATALPPKHPHHTPTPNRRGR
jgi:hypothetical protein